MHGRPGPTGQDFLVGGGDMGARIRAYDWASTPLGPPEFWPQSFRSTLSICLHSSFPMAIYWGPELRLLYNDAWSGIPGPRHPAALGRPADEVWADIWDVVGPQFEAVLATGQGFSTRNQLLPMRRYGEAEETYWDYSFTPIHAEDGRIAGILNIGQETTAQVLAERRLSFSLALEDRLRSLTDPLEVIAAAEETLGRHLGASRVGYGDLDATSRYFTTERNWTDGTVEHHAGTHDLAGFGAEILEGMRRGETLVVHDAARDPRTNSPEHLAAFAFIETRGAVTVSLIKGGRMTAAMYVHQSTPRSWRASEVALIEEVAERTWSAVERARAEAALRRQRENESERLRRLFEQAPSLMAVLRGPDHVFELANAAYLQLVGYRDVLGKPLRAALPELDGQGFFELLDGVLATGEPFVGRDVSVLLQRSPGGRPEKRHVDFVFQPIRDEDGGVSGIFVDGYDVTERKHAADAVRESEEHFRTVADSLPQIAFSCGPDGAAEWVNARAYEYAGLAPENVLGAAWLDAAHPDDRERAMAAWRHAVATGEDLGAEFRLRRHDGVYRWFLARATPLRNERGDVVRWFGTCTDVQDHRDAREHQRLLINELNHRVKNTLATVQAIATQTLRNAASLSDARTGIDERLIALSRAHDVLTHENWESASLGEIVGGAIEPFRSYGETRFLCNGPPVRLSPRMALALAMALHELATNAVKYGALANAAGTVAVTWSVDPAAAPARLHLTWREEGGPPVAPPARRGFGSRLIERSLARDLDGHVAIAFPPEGVTCTVDAPLA